MDKPSTSKKGKSKKPPAPLGKGRWSKTPPQATAPLTSTSSPIEVEDEGNCSSSDSEFEVLQVGQQDEDYFEIPHRRKRDRGPNDPPPPETKDLVYIPKEKLHPFKDLYEKQPQKIKEMMRVTFCDGKPIINPTPLSQFVNGVRRLQDKKKNRKQAQRRLLRTNLTKNAEQGPEGKKKVQAKVNLVDISEGETQLVHVDYPGRVVHLDKAIETMGGMGQVTRVFNNVNKKLNVRFRPEDPGCNSVKGEATPTIGLLLRVRYRKPTPAKQASKNPKTEESSLPTTSKTKVEQVDDDSIIINGVRMTKEQILYEDNQLLKQVSSKNEKFLHQYQQNEDLGDCYLRVPKNYTPIVDQKIQIEAVGLVNRSYKFDGICDFQYLPSKNTKVGVPVSTREELFPVIGKPSDDNESLFVCNKLYEDEERELHIDFLPPMMSRVDRPVDTVIEHMMDSDNIKLTAELKEKSGVISTTRARRNVYTLFYNFQSEKQLLNPIPTEPLTGAIEDIQKRPQYESLMELVKKYFDQRPIWTKAELETELKHISFQLKYALPCVAYFATNGPWRALWIRLGFDPREHQASFLWQSIDFRVPGVYKGFLEEKSDVISYIFRPNLMPTRGQIFYQLCHIHCEEVDRLIEIASKKASNNELSYDIRFGWLKEGTLDYIRHVITQYLECYLEELGKIPEHPTSQIFLPDNELEPPEKLLPRPRIVKRIRKAKSYKRKVQTPAAASSKSKKVTTAKRKSKVKKESSKWEYQGILEDLSIKDINQYGSRKEEDKEILDEDYSLLSDDDYEDETTTEDDSEDLDDAEVTPETANK